MAGFEQEHKNAATTELWELFIRKTKASGLGTEFLAAVEKVCALGLDLSKTIIAEFRNFTFHDETHSANVCRWMMKLLGDRAQKLTAHEAALLLMAACCHDIGMSIGAEQRKMLCDRGYEKWDAYFAQDRNAAAEYERTGVISEEMLHGLVRRYHHELVGLYFPEELGDRLYAVGIDPGDLLEICGSHGSGLSRDRLIRKPKYDMMLCAVLLRLADLLDYDISRAPMILFRHMGLDDPKSPEEARSAAEHRKNQVGSFEEIRDGIIYYRAIFPNLQTEQDVRKYLAYVKEELDLCAKNLAQTAGVWNEPFLPHDIDTQDIRRDGYAYGEFRLTMEQDKIIRLLTGENLYADPGVFVRELLQNSIDAVLLRVRQDPSFSLDQGRIIIDTWPADGGDTWFRIRDNGVGMDEHIITDYFLKVGNSYYTSEEFRQANRSAPGGSYTAISRFGIGILSCFMCDPDQTELKVSTKRFPEGQHNGIRLDVTGLHGYYHLAHEKTHKEHAKTFLKMPSCNEQDQGYRRKAGTTICVRTNLFRLGSLQSFQEILDRYVVFPEVRVEYHGPEGDKVYPTQQELMDAVHELNPDGVVKEYVHELPDAVLQGLKWSVGDLDQLPRPALILKYYPVDLLTDSDKLTGVEISVTARGCNDRGFWCASVYERKNISITWDSYLDRYSEHERPFFDIAVTGTGSVLSPQEKRLWELCGERPPLMNPTDYQIAYNGVLVSEDCEDVYWHRQLSGIHILLLREDFIPEVKLSRTGLTSLPLEAACCFEKIANRFNMRTRAEYMTHASIRMATEREFQEVLDRHPSWEAEAMERQTIGLYIYDIISTSLQVAACKRHNSVLLQWRHANGNWELVRTQKPADEATVDFPSMMFVLMDTDWLSILCNDYRLYNRSHPFSKWLIENRALLDEKAHGVYDTLIRAMMLSADADVIRSTLNAILDRLRRMDGNCFHVPDGLSLTEEDFLR